MKQVKYFLLVLLGSFLMASCNKQIQEKQADPNNPTTVPPGLILGTVLTDISGTGAAGALVQPGHRRVSIPGTEHSDGTNIIAEL